MKTPFRRAPFLRYGAIDHIEYRFARGAPDNLHHSADNG
ncbi:hypothetical protein C7S17_4079 [Burkholderia thailandensis]|nr:hypothetical protein [Burkholderia thailandensis]